MQIDKTNRKEKSLGDSKRPQNEELEKVNKKIPKKKMMLNLLLSNFFCFITKSNEIRPKFTQGTLFIDMKVRWNPKPSLKL